VLEPTCVIKLASLVCTLLAAGSHAFDFQFASHLFEVGDRTGEAALAFRESGSRDIAGKAVERLRRHIERDYDVRLTQEFRSDPAGHADARAAIASFDFVLPRCLPDAAAVVAAKYDPQAIAALVVRRAARLEEAVAAYRAALEERSRERVPLQWATTQNNLGTALSTLGERESGTARLEEAISCWDACLTVVSSAWLPEWVQIVRSSRDDTLAEIARRSAK
jgi:tetratricopeptide (TPR) repeat protein